MPLLVGPPSFRRGDPFLDAVIAAVEPVFALLGAQDAEALEALSVAYPEFRSAHAVGKVGHHFMVARSDALPKSEASSWWPRPPRAIRRSATPTWWSRRPISGRGRRARRSAPLASTSLRFGRSAPWTGAPGRCRTR